MKLKDFFSHSYCDYLFNRIYISKAYTLVSEVIVLIILYGFVANFAFLDFYQRSIFFV